ncbi:MAG: D-alanine--D-alanine ligase [Clostridia bacterium]|nr:D-alanine--D-alanine ligase [Clostridia bacterium]
MKNIAVFFGSRSAEHDVSIVTAAQCMENLSAAHYNIIPVYLGREGLWYTGEKLRDVKFLNALDTSKVNRCYLPAEPGACLEIIIKKKKVMQQPINCALIAVHGMHGEDGTLQGLLELCDIPYTSCGVGASAAGLNKVTMKHVLRGAGLPVVEDVPFYRDEWEKDPDGIIKKIEKALNYPVFVKPASLGSSIGISHCRDLQELTAGINLACMYDRLVLVEKAVQNPRELNCAALGLGCRVRASAIEEPMRTREFLSYADKYIGDSGKSQGMKTLKRKLPADIPEETAATVRELTEKAFVALDCKGVVRIDFLMDADGKVLINEINTVPGSMAFYLWEPQGLSFSALLDEMIKLAEEAAADRRRNTYAFQSGILTQYAAGTKNSGK